MNLNAAKLQPKELSPERPAGLTLAELIPQITFEQPQAECVVTDIVLDSRVVVPGSIFVALKGSVLNRESFIDSAFQQGALAVLKEATRFQIVKDDVGLIIGIPNLKAYAGEFASRFFGNPSNRLTLVGITGTNGKTSCADYLLQVWTSIGKAAASVGTLGWRVGRHDYCATGLTTLDVIENHRLMSRFVESGITHVVMEVSSHGIDQGRIGGLNFNATALSNITRDHLDYHGSFENYARTKLGFLGTGNAFVVVNLDDQQGRVFVKNKEADGRIVSFSLRDHSASVYCVDMHHTLSGTIITVVVGGERFTCNLSLIGPFNVSNILLVMSILISLGENAPSLTSVFDTIEAAPGRLQRIKHVFVDYAHTPDALANALIALKPHCERKLLLVFGCGGDRDVGKRAEMAKIAEQHADFTVVTSDNPRSENPSRIIDDIVVGFKKKDAFQIEEDRAKAIQLAVKKSKDGDIVLIAGKGHENYQEINGKRISFSDCDEVRRWVA